MIKVTKGLMENFTVYAEMVNCKKVHI